MLMVVAMSSVSPFVDGIQGMQVRLRGQGCRAWIKVALQSAVWRQLRVSESKAYRRPVRADIAGCWPPVMHSGLAVELFNDGFEDPRVSRHFVFQPAYRYMRDGDGDGVVCE